MPDTTGDLSRPSGPRNRTAIYAYCIVCDRIRGTDTLLMTDGGLMLICAECGADIKVLR